MHYTQEIADRILKTRAMLRRSFQRLPLFAAHWTGTAKELASFRTAAAPPPSQYAHASRLPANFAHVFVRAKKTQSSARSPGKRRIFPGLTRSWGDMTWSCAQPFRLIIEENAAVLSSGTHSCGPFHLTQRYPAGSGLFTALHKHCRHLIFLLQIISISPGILGELLRESSGRISDLGEIIHVPSSYIHAEILGDTIELTWSKDVRAYWNTHSIQVPTQHTAILYALLLDSLQQAASSFHLSWLPGNTGLPSTTPRYIVTPIRQIRISGSSGVPQLMLTADGCFSRQQHPLNIQSPTKSVHGAHIKECVVTRFVWCCRHPPPPRTRNHTYHAPLFTKLSRFRRAKLYLP